MKSREIKNVLIARFSALGDVAMTIPVVYNMCRSNEQVRFIFITRRLPSTIFLNKPANLEVLPIELDHYRGIAGMRRLAAELKEAYGIDAFADLHGSLRTRMLRFFLRLSGVKTACIHKQRLRRNALTRARNKVMLPLTPTRARYREVFWNLGLPREDSFDHIFQGAEPSPEVYAAATPPRAPGERWIAVAPFAAHAGKIYPLDLMEQVVAALAARRGFKIFLFGAGGEESATLARWRARYGEQLVNMAELRLGLPAEMALLRHCSVMLSMDSANMHLASLVRLRVVSIWGATHPYCGFMGWHQRREDAVQLDMVCRPCSIYGNRPCRRGDYHCLRGIQPAYIISHIDRLLKLQDDKKAGKQSPGPVA